MRGASSVAAFPFTNRLAIRYSIEAQARALGLQLKTEVFATRASWQDYAVQSLGTVLRLAKELGLQEHLHLWPDKSLGSQALADRMPNPRQYLKRLEHWWHRVSEWPRANSAEK